MTAESNAATPRLSFGAGQLARYTAWSTLDSVALRASDALVQILLVVVLARSEYGLLGLAISYLHMVGFLSFQPEAALLRYLPQAEGEANRERLLAECYAVTLYKTLLLSARFLVIGGVLWLVSPELALLTIALGVLTDLRLLQAALSLLLKLADKNATAVVLNFLFRVVQLGCLAAALTWQQNVWSYVAAMASCQLLATLAVWWICIRELKVKSWPPPRDAIAFWPVLVNFVGWAHLSVYLVSLIFATHTVLLSWAGANLSTVGTFSLGVRIAAFFFIVPMAMQGGATLAVSSVPETADRLRRLGAYLRLIGCVSMVQLGVFWLAGPWLFEQLFLLKGNNAAAANAAEIYQTALPLVLGATLLNLLRPCVGYATATLPMYVYTLGVCLPAAVLATISYAVSAAVSPVAVGWTVLFCYPLTGILSTTVAVGWWPLLRSLFDITASERQVLAKIASYLPLSADRSGQTASN